MKINSEFDEKLEVSLREIIAKVDSGAFKISEDEWKVLKDVDVTMILRKIKASNDPPSIEMYQLIATVNRFVRNVFLENDVDDKLTSVTKLFLGMSLVSFRFVEIKYKGVVDETENAIINNEDYTLNKDIYKYLMKLKTVGEVFDDTALKHKEITNVSFDKPLRKVDVLKEDLKTIQQAVQLEFSLNTNVEKVKQEKFAHIFCNNGYQLFVELLEKVCKPKGEKGHKNDVIYILLSLIEDKYIHSTKALFIDWYEEEYGVSLQLKTLNEVRSSTRDNMYRLVLDSFKNI